MTATKKSIYVATYSDINTDIPLDHKNITILYISIYIDPLGFTKLEKVLGWITKNH